MNSLNMMVAIPPRDACPRFNPEGWDEQELHFKDKPFVRVTTRSIFHIPINMGRIFSRTHKVLEKENAVDKDQLIVLSRDISPWKSEHFFAVNKEVQEQEMANLSGDYLTRVFEGPYKDASKWYQSMQKYIEKSGRSPKDIYLFYTSCPKCAKYYGKNYIVAFGKAA